MNTLYRLKCLHALRKTYCLLAEETPHASCTDVLLSFQTKAVTALRSASGSRDRAWRNQPLFYSNKHSAGVKHRIRVSGFLNQEINAVRRRMEDGKKCHMCANSIAAASEFIWKNQLSTTKYFEENSFTFAGKFLLKEYFSELKCWKLLFSEKFPCIVQGN